MGDAILTASHGVPLAVSDSEHANLVVDAVRATEGILARQEVFGFQVALAHEMERDVVVLGRRGGMLQASYAGAIVLRRDRWLCARLARVLLAGLRHLLAFLIVLAMAFQKQDATSSWWQRLRRSAGGCFLAEDL